MIKAVKQRRELRRQRVRRRKELQWRLDWVIQHESVMDPAMRPAAIDFLKGSIAELDKPRKIKKALPARKAPLRNRLRHLVTLILSQTQSTGK